MNRIKRVSLLFSIVFQLFFIAIPTFVALAWMSSPESLVMFGGTINMNFIPRAYISLLHHPLTMSERWMGFGVSMLPVIVSLYILYSLIKLFKLYGRGEIYSMNNIRYIRRVGYGLLASQVGVPIYQSLMGVVLTWHYPAGHNLRLIAITLDQTNLGILLIALLVLLISWIMAEGCKLYEEQQLTI